MSKKQLPEEIETDAFIDELIEEGFDLEIIESVLNDADFLQKIDEILDEEEKEEGEDN